VKITAAGRYIPSVRVDSSDLDRKFGLAPGTVERATGVCTRYYGAEGESAPYMGARAVTQALERAGVSLAEVDALISVSGTHAQLVPCTASLVLEAMGELDAGIAAFDLNATCLGFIVGLDTAAHLVAAGRYGRVVLVAAEAPSVMLSPTEWESASLIGDAAAAVVLERTPDGEPSSLHWSHLATYPRGVPLCETRALGTTRHPDGPRPPTAADHHFHMDGISLVGLTYELAPAFRAGFPDGPNASLDDFDLIVPHQASGPAVRFMMRRFACDAAKVFLYLRDYGNLVAASIPIGLQFAEEEGRLRRGDRVLLVGTGAGLALGAASLVY
jgi:3-oxoacyl-[acyl-carrier-protein] synthase-3